MPTLLRLLFIRLRQNGMTPVRIGIHIGLRLRIDLVWIRLPHLLFWRVLAGRIRIAQFRATGKRAARFLRIGPQRRIQGDAAAVFFSRILVIDVVVMKARHYRLLWG